MFNDANLGPVGFLNRHSQLDPVVLRVNAVQDQGFQPAPICRPVRQYQFVHLVLVNEEHFVVEPFTVEKGGYYRIPTKPGVGIDTRREGPGEIPYRIGVSGSVESSRDAG